MKSSTLLEAIKSRVLLGDGAMGTQMQIAGLESGGCGEAWALDHPEKILKIQRGYVEAGSDILLTSTFGASRIMLNRHGQADRTMEINRAAVGIAREALGGRGFVLGDIGPFGGLMEPYGDIARDDVERAFREQAKALMDGGADGIIIETQTALEELEIGIAAAHEAGAPVVIGSVAFDMLADGSGVRTMMGISPEQAAEFMVKRGCHILGLNCGTLIDMKTAADITKRYKSVSDLPVMAQPNAGQPVLENMQVLYKQTPEEMAEGLTDVISAGARIVGGCCGSTPAHIRRFRIIIDQLQGVAK
ncbi:MAG: homocysteine methyltransferase [Acidobacteria bacterium]|nr:MAG: homocysteine methyltransferase [Acidobacteriota bacterium]